MNWFDLSDSGDGALLAGVPFSSGKTRLEQIEPLVFQEAASGAQAVFQKDSRGRVAYLYDQVSIFPFATYVKAGWHANPLLHLALLGVCALIFLSALLAGIFGGLARLARRKASPVPSNLARLARAAALLVAFLDLAATLAFLAITLFSGQLMTTLVPYGQMSTINAILTAWLLAAVLAVALLPLAVLAWRRSFWSLAGRIHYTLVAAAAGAFVWFLSYWNLLGYRY